MNQIRRITLDGRPWLSDDDLRKAIRDPDLILRAAAMLKVARIEHHDSAIRALQMAFAHFYVEATGDKLPGPRKTRSPKEARRGVVTAAEMAAMKVHSGWSDGRLGYLWCRFDGIVSEEFLLRAEVTWDDDSDETEDSAPTAFFDPQLLLESNRIVKDGGSTRWETVDTHVMDLTQEQLTEALRHDPSRLLYRYPVEFLDLTFKYGRTPCNDGATDASPS